jgi:hypothetical protein
MRSYNPSPTSQKKRGREREIKRGSPKAVLSGKLMAVFLY